MTEEMVVDNDNKNNGAEKAPADDDNSVNTVKAGEKTDYVAKEMKELTLRFEFVVKKKEDFQLTMIRHIEVMRAFCDCGDTNDIMIYDNKNNKVEGFYDQKWKDVDYYKNHFNVHSGKKKMGMSFYVIHRVRTNMSLSTIKSDRKVFRALQQNEGYMKSHQWCEDVWKIQDVGFILHFDPSKHPKEHVMEVLAEKFKNEGIKPKEIPKYHLIHASPNTKVKGEKINAQAYSIQVESINAAKMDKALKRIYKNDTKYVQYKMKNKMHEAYARAIYEQARFVKSINIVPMYGITEEMIFYLQSHLLEIDGVEEYLPTKATESKGRWNLIVLRKHVNEVRKLLSEKLPSMVLELVAEDARRTPEGFPEPKVETNEDSWFNDDKSEGANSYMSLCAQSYNSFEGDETIEIDANQPQYKPQFVDKTLSYANATKGNNSEQISDVTSPEISEVLELKAKVKALEDLVKQLTGEKQKTDKLEDKPKNGASETSVPTIITVENEISKRMLDIETRMESSIKKAMMEMMETLRVEREENKFTNESDEDRDSETMQKQQSGSVGRSDNKKRDRKTTPQKAGTAGRGGGYERPRKTVDIG